VNKEENLIFWSGFWENSIIKLLYKKYMEMDVVSKFLHFFIGKNSKTGVNFI